MSDKVREEFESWAWGEHQNTESNPIAIDYIDEETQAAWDGFRAGRESMRREAVAACESKVFFEDELATKPTVAAFNNAAVECADAIRGIA